MVDLAQVSDLSPEPLPGPFKRGNETGLTYELKMAAWEWLYREAGCRVIGLEVKLEGPGGRIADLAAVGPQNTFYIVEVKSSRSDFSRDDHTAGDLTILQGQEGKVAGRTGLAKDTLRQAMDYAKAASPEGWREAAGLQAGPGRLPPGVGQGRGVPQPRGNLQHQIPRPPVHGHRRLPLPDRPQGRGHPRQSAAPVGVVGRDSGGRAPCVPQRGPEEHRHRLQLSEGHRPEQHYVDDVFPGDRFHEGRSGPDALEMIEVA